MKDNLRREKRISAKNLPNELGEFYMTPAESGTEKIKAVDASYGGFGFTTKIDPVDFPDGSHLKLYPFGVKQPIKARVIYKTKIGKVTRVGVQLMPSEGYRRYLEKMKTVYDKEV